VIERVVEKRGGFGSAVLGGAVAAVIGFALGQGGVLNSILPPSLRPASVDVTAIEAEQAALRSDLSALKTQVEGISIPDLAPLSQRIDAVEGTVGDLSAPQSDALEAEIAALVERLTALEQRPVADAGSPEAIAAVDAQLAKLQDSLAAQRAEVEQMLAEARQMDQASAEAARIASAQTVLARLRSSLDSGASYAGLVDELAALDVTVPEALTSPADSGVATLTGLADSFTPAARSALAAAREETKGTGGVMDYLKRHLGARSVAPREGDDPDAVLSRVGALVDQGKIADALAELDALPETSRTALADWESAARSRVAAVAAADELAQSLNAK
jgi:hypothetical protein